ncbi:MAG: hypothetical protein L6V78_06625 [Clostridium sp.]|nr:MAG: hypothetical protein L6V78_06625 [Clostridium sp.]
MFSLNSLLYVSPEYLANAALALLFTASQGLATPVALSLCKISLTEPSPPTLTILQHLFANST